MVLFNYSVFSNSEYLFEHDSYFIIPFYLFLFREIKMLETLLTYSTKLFGRLYFNWSCLMIIVKHSKGKDVTSMCRLINHGRQKIFSFGHCGYFYSFFALPFLSFSLLNSLFWILSLWNKLKKAICGGVYLTTIWLRKLRLMFSSFLM